MSGDRYFEAKQYFEAVVEYRNAVKFNPRSGIAHAKLAEAYLKASRAPEAAEQYQVAADLLPDDPDVQLKWLKIQVIRQQYDEVREKTEKLLAVDPKNGAALAVHANAMAGLKEVGRAVTEMEQAIELDPANADTYYIDLAAFQLQLQNPDEAEKAFNSAVQVDPASVKAQLALGANEWARGRLVPAERALKRAVELDPQNLAANRALLVLYLRTDRPAEARKHLEAIAEIKPTPAIRMLLADYYVKMNMVDEATKLLTALTAGRETSAEARGRLANLAYSTGRKDEAHRQLDEALAKDPTSPWALQMKASFLISEGKADVALPLLKAALIVDSRSIAAHTALGSIYAQKGDTAAAIREFTDVLKLGPQSIPVQTELARLLLLDGRPAAALGFADQALKASPQDVQIQLLQARALIDSREMVRADTAVKALLHDHADMPEVYSVASSFHLANKNPTAAREVFERWLALKPDDLDALSRLLAFELSSGRGPRAQALVEQRLARQPNNPVLYRMAGQTYAASGSMEKAEAALRKAVELNRTDPASYAILAQFYYSQHQIERAVLQFEEAVTQNVNPVINLTIIGMIYDMQGKQDEAEKHYQKALLLDPKAPVAANNMAWIYAARGANLDLALKWAQAAKDAVPEHPVINDTLGWILYKKDEASLAIPPLEISVAQDPKNPVFRYHLGLAYKSVGQSDRARSELTQALKLKPDFENAVETRKALALLPRER